MDTGLDKSAQYLLEVYGPLAMGWVVAVALLVLLVLVIRWTLSEQREWRKVSDDRAQAYHDVVRENTETTAKQAVIFEERTRAILEYIKDRPR